MTIEISIHIPDIFEIAFEIVVLPLTGPALPPEVNTKEIIKHDFIPDRRTLTFRLLGKPSLGQSPPGLSPDKHEQGIYSVFHQNKSNVDFNIENLNAV
jgi:hypothetical protein